MKKVFILIFSIFLITNVNANKKDITNINFKPSVHKGKIGKAYEIVNSDSGEPVIGKSAYKFVAIPFDCGNDEFGHTDCGNLDKKKIRIYQKEIELGVNSVLLIIHLVVSNG